MRISGPPMSALATATRCCWPTLSLFTERTVQFGGEVQGVPAVAGRSSLTSADSAARDFFGPRTNTPASRSHRREVRQQVELLEHDTDVVGPKLITATRRERGEIRAEESDRPTRRCVDATQQVQQRRLAAPARAAHEQVLASVEMQLVDRDDVRRLTRPPESHLVEADDFASRRRSPPEREDGR